MHTTRTLYTYGILYSAKSRGLLLNYYHIIYRIFHSWIYLQELEKYVAVGSTAANRMNQCSRFDEVWHTIRSTASKPQTFLQIFANVSMYEKFHELYGGNSKY